MEIYKEEIINCKEEIINYKDEVTTTFGKRLKAIRHKKGVSMEEVALAIGSTKSAMSRYENGLMTPTLDSAQKIADYFMVTVDWLGGGGEEDEINTSVPQTYINAIKRAISKNITAKQLEEAIDFIIKTRG